ncbi:bifunctional riboflavin kinase/FAD synthetase [Bdellovibrio sp. SKB1291214]|uniref:bifunctional riboflavin kinase/FAD synthetase n=1 Tax=Bdellovibrio sp. SKB1291214 TaxID=1732569 RepID=UPI00223ED2CF|nr:bifunctional riboflavin kinase/FAD synthetase [Bdellovibrio sp. SKB1291214]UYL08519.1 bifunctional riboflavin kinase/FAD synthetase [Bdellovibrio sp. SKB1291214]
MSSDIESSVVTIGNFDGVHLGHQQLIETVTREAQHYGVPSVVYTFHPHPVKVLFPERQTQRMFDLRDQQEQFQARGIECVILENFTKEFSQVTAQDFLQKYVMDKLHPKTLVVGHDFNFGTNRTGNISFLEGFCAQHGIRLIVIPPFQKDGLVVSSTRIREALQAGEIEKAESLLGRRYYLRGMVEKGFQRGRTIGVPTANVHPDVEFVPRKGVYFTNTRINGHAHPSITNIGVNPTFQEDKKGPVKIESHIFDLDAQLYGVEVEVELLHFQRDEMKFSGIDTLKEQIYSDMAAARKYFNEQKDS